MNLMIIGTIIRLAKSELDIMSPCPNVFIKRQVMTAVMYIISPENTRINRKNDF